MITRRLFFIGQHVVCSHRTRPSHLNLVRTLSQPNFQERKTQSRSNFSQPFRQFVPDENNFLFSVVNANKCNVLDQQIDSSIECLNKIETELCRDSISNSQRSLLGQVIRLMKLDEARRINQFAELFHALQQNCRQHLDDHQLFLVMKAFCFDQILSRQLLVNSVYTFFDNGKVGTDLVLINQ